MDAAMRTALHAASIRDDVTQKITEGIFDFTDAEKNIIANELWNHGYTYKMSDMDDGMMWFDSVLNLLIPQHQMVLMTIWHMTQNPYNARVYASADYDDVEYTNHMRGFMRHIINQLVRTRTMLRVTR